MVPDSRLFRSDNILESTSRAITPSHYLTGDSK
jgi:hypothetical protein